MSASALLAMLALGQSSTAEEERSPLPIVIVSPSRQDTRISQSSLVRIAGEVLEGATSYRAVETESDRITNCKGRLGCITVEALGLTAGARHVLVLSQLGRGEIDLLSVALVDALEAKKIFDANPEELEVEVSAKALVAPERREEVGSEADARAFLALAVESDFRRAFEAAGTWSSFGTVEIECAVAGLALSLDGRSVGATSAGITRIERAKIGKRRLTASAPSYRLLQTDVEVRTHEVAQVRLEPEANEGNYGALRTMTMIAGGVVGTAGLGIGIYSLAIGPSEVARVCIDRPSGSCQTAHEFQRFPRRTRDDYEIGGTANGGGPAIFPLGLALVTAGLAWTIGTLLFTEPDEAPWIELLVGAIAAPLVYGGLLLTETEPR